MQLLNMRGIKPFQKGQPLPDDYKFVAVQSDAGVLAGVQFAAACKHVQIAEMLLQRFALSDETIVGGGDITFLGDTTTIKWGSDSLRQMYGQDQPEDEATRTAILDQIRAELIILGAIVPKG